MTKTSKAPRERLDEDTENSKSTETFKDFLELAERLKAQAPEEFEGFMEDIPKSPPNLRDPFEGWEE